MMLLWMRILRLWIRGRILRNLLLTVMWEIHKARTKRDKKFHSQPEESSSLQGSYEAVPAPANSNFYVVLCRYCHLLHRCYKKLLFNNVYIKGRYKHQKK